MKTRKLLSVLLATTMLMSIFTGITVPALANVQVNILASFNGEEWGGVPYFTTTGDKTISDQSNEVVSKLYPTMELSFTNKENPEDVKQYSNEGSMDIPVGTYSVSQTNPTYPYPLENDNLTLIIDEDRAARWDEGSNGGLIQNPDYSIDSNPTVVIWLDVKPEYSEHTYKIVWPEDTTYKRAHSIPVYVGDTMVADFIVDEGVEELTFKRLVYAEDGSKIEYEIKPKAFGTDPFWSEYKFGKIETVEDTTTITLEEITYEIDFEVLPGAVCTIKDPNDEVIWSSAEENAANPKLCIGKYYTVEYSTVPDGYAKTSQKLVIDGNASLRYDSEEVIKELYKLESIPKVTLTPNVEVASAHSHTVCGDADCIEHGEELQWVEITQTMVDEGLTLEAGKYYYLGSDITATEEVSLPVGESALCLNGHKWEVGDTDYAAFHYEYGNAGTFSICDCSEEETGEIISSYSTIGVAEECTVNVYGGCLKSLAYHTIITSQRSIGYDGAINEVGGLLNMYGGTVTTENSAPVVSNGGIMNLYGGSIEGQQALVTNGYKSEAHLYGGSISGNLSFDSYISSCAIDMFGDVYIEGDVAITGAIKIWSTDDDEAQFVINVPMKNEDPFEIDATFFDEYHAFTRGWAVNMADEKPADYFTVYDSEEPQTIYLNPVGELWLSEGHKHPVCGDADCEEHEEDVSWIPLTQAMVNKSTELPAGNYFLIGDISTSGLVLQGEVNICFNGYTMTAAEDDALLYLWANEDDDKIVNLCDCGNDGGLYGSYSGGAFRGNMIEVGQGAALNIYGGTYLSENTGDSAQLIRSWGYVNIYGGNFKSTGASGVFLEGNYVDEPSLVNFYGGTFDSSESTESFVTLWGTANLFGGKFIAGTGKKAIDIGGSYHIGFNGAATVDGYIDIRENCLLKITEAMPEDAHQYTILTSTLGEIKEQVDWDDDGPIYEVVTPADPYADFTTGWYTQMGNATVSDYFVGLNGEIIICDADTGELHVAKTHKVELNSTLIGGTVTTDKEAAVVGETVTLTVTPSENFELVSLTVTDENGNEIETTEAAAAEGISLAAESTSTDYTFTMPDSAVYVTAEFARSYIDSVFTINADVASNVEDVREESADVVDVYAGTEVAVNISLSGDDFTTADWKLVYESNKFEYLYYETNSDYDDICSFELDNSLSNVLSGKVYGNAGYVEDKADEFIEDTVIVTYYFRALPQSSDLVTGTFNFVNAHANTYQMAANQDNTPVKDVKNEAINIVLNNVAVGGTFDSDTVTYNGLLQKLNPVVLETEFLDATVTYLWEDGLWYTEMPEYKDVGTYEYTAKIAGAGLEEKTLTATLTIEPLDVYPTARFNVDPDVNSIEVTPVIEGVVDGSYKGSVEVVLTLNGEEIDRWTYDDAASAFTFDGESSAVCNEAHTVSAATSGKLVATVTYTAADVDNYKNGTGIGEVELDKLTVENWMVDEIDEYVVHSVFEYDGEDHRVSVDTDWLNDMAFDPAADWSFTIVDAFDADNTDPYVTEVGDEKLVKVTFTDNNGAYNDVIIYTVLKVVPREIIIDVHDKDKRLGDSDPEFTWDFILVSDSSVPSEEVLVNENDLGTISAVRERGETAGEYEITVKYVPNKNYTVTINPGILTIGAPEFFVEVVDPSRIYGGDYTPDYIAGHRLILVHTNGNKAYFQYNGQNMFDVTDAGYEYFDNAYDQESGVQYGRYAHVYGVVVAADEPYDVSDPAASEAFYKSKVSFAGSEDIYAPVRIITYDENINMSENLDISDYSTTNGVYNVLYDREDYIESIFKADYNNDKMVDSNDAWDVKSEISSLTGE